MADELRDTTWQEDSAHIIILANHSKHNYILNLPSGRYRLDAGRKMRTLKTILDLPEVQKLVDDGFLTLES